MHGMGVMVCGFLWLAEFASWLYMEGWEARESSLLLLNCFQLKNMYDRIFCGDILWLTHR
jgi:hypothetical protein